MLNPQTAYNILMYSHDTYGLGHIRRTMSIANHLRDRNTNVLILTGSPIAGRFRLPEQVDFVRIPGMIKKTNDEYQSLSIRIDQEKALAIRRDIILATAKSFDPHLVIVDKEPQGLKKEMLPTLEWLKRNRPRTMTVLGLRDILDDEAVIRQDWQTKNVYSCLDEMYDEIWVYGNRDIYDPISAYAIPEPIQDKIRFTGYIPRKHHSPGIRRNVRRRYRIMEDDTFLLITTGGGGDGFEVVEHFLDMNDYYPTSLPFKSLIVTGPFMPKRKREEIKKRARKYGIKTLPFHPRIEELIAAADLVISMGGYNTICEILTQRTPALIIPRETPRREQLIRAERLQNKGLLDFIPWKEVTPQLFRDKIFGLLDQDRNYHRSIEAFALTGIEIMQERLAYFRTCNGSEHC